MTATVEFAYRAVDSHGRATRGRIVADSVITARANLVANGLLPFALSPARSAAMNSRIPARDLATGLRILANLVGGNVPIERALGVLQEIAPAAWKPALPAVRESVRQGLGLAGALSTSRLGVPAVIVGIVRAGESGLGLAKALEQAARLAESTASVRARFRSALAYPLVVAVAGVGSIGVLVGVVLPRFAGILSDFNQQLPPATRLVVLASRTAPTLAVPLGVVVAACLATLVAMSRSASGRARLHGFLLNAPLLGPTRHALASGRFATALAALLQSGVPLERALALAGEATGDAAVQRRVENARIAIASGERLSRALENSGAVTNATVRLVRAGEESGNHAEMLEHAALLESERAERAAQTVLRLVEPVLLLVLSGIVAIVSAALLQAVYAIRPAV